MAQHLGFPDYATSENLAVLRNQVFHGNDRHPALLLQNLGLSSLSGSWWSDDDDQGTGGLRAEDSGKSKETTSVPRSSEPCSYWITISKR